MLPTKGAGNMDELGNSNLQIVLSIKEGKGFEQISQSTILIATLNGHSLKSDVIEPNSNPQYATDLIWDTDKISVRKMRCGQTPLKLECFALKDLNNKEKIGYILLSIRSAQIIPNSKKLKPKSNWHTLLGLKNNFKAQKPELLLSLSIEDRECVTSNSLTKKFTEIDMHRNPAGDFEKYACKKINQDYKSIYSTNCLEENSIPVISQLPNHIEAYHFYCLDIIFAGIKLSSGPAIQNIEFRFHHPKTEMTYTVDPKISVPLGEKVKFEDIGCKLHFISATNEIKQLLFSCPLKISIYNLGDLKTYISQFSLDVKQLFHQNKWKCEYEMPLYNSEKIKVGELDVVLSLQDHGPYYRMNQNVSDQKFGPPIIDDSLAYKIVDELETWKERQKEIFRVKLKKKEDRHLNLLSEEWQRQKENLELKLACSVEQCKMLANNLNKATDDLRTRRLQSLEKEARLIKANEDLQWRYESKVQELTESLRVTKEESALKIHILEEKHASLEARIEPLSVENEKLRQMLTKQVEELEAYQKGSLTQDQTATLLQELKTLEEKYNNAQRNKTFFKEEWGKAVREIHRMKREYQETIEIQIKNSKEELKNLGLEEILCTDSTALTNDQILLGQIQKEINVFKPNSLMKPMHQQMLSPTSKIFSKNCLTNMKTVLHKSDEYDERLQALIEERDSLLKTGSYTNDDTVIVKLNMEIRNILMNV
ncbi:centrosomal protein of 120 kDa-like isoform X2 [Polistes fuscatus]|uniref:centrosomal protein of 120 kDa-like isoform X2 n=1 Tax=Polistes fuscatus TaxID=30207 RepID=UPI001CA9FA82|nr:centrosomal protein of 120 kDa-like isoform X2 [Polistes fuscatus]